MNRMAVVEWWRSATEFVSDVRTELKNVSWPSKKEVQGTTAVVIAAVVIFGLYLWIVDIIVGMGIHSIFNLFGVGRQ